MQGVLDATAGLLNEESQKLFTAADAAVLTVAVLLHDAGMHLTPDGFLGLLRQPDRAIPVLDERPWREEWSAFVDEAHRWDDRTLRSVFGDVSCSSLPFKGDYAKYIRTPEEMGTPEEWPPAYCKFIGEFIRLHHPRLAHEFAIGPLPCPPGETPLHLIESRQDIANLSGFIARSHGMNLRDTFPYVKEMYHGRHIALNAHATFLMVLLRIADYLELVGQSDCA